MTMLLSSVFRTREIIHYLCTCDNFHYHSFIRQQYNIITRLSDDNITFEIFISMSVIWKNSTPIGGIFYIYYFNTLCVA